MTDRCDCCEGTESVTPLPHENRPGLSALRYRAGTHGSFMETMLAALSLIELEVNTGEFDIDGQPVIEFVRPLAHLRTRDTDDPAIALLDAWACVADVLTFYNERIVNEGYLRTAVERRSVLEIARLIGYMLRPGVAAAVYLAYTLEKDSSVIIPAGSRAQSVPVSGEETIQSFETIADLDARYLWNELTPRRTRPQHFRASNRDGETLLANAPPVSAIYLPGTVTTLRKNELLVFELKGGFNPTPRLIKTVVPEADGKSTRVELVTGDIVSALTPLYELVPEAPQALANPIQPKAEAPPVPLQVIARQFGSLNRAPSRPPANEARLPRQLADSFSLSANTSAKLFAAVAPRLRDTVFAATAGTDTTILTGGSTVTRLSVMRVKAAPFGASAPPRTALATVGNAQVTTYDPNWSVISETFEPILLAINEDPTLLILDAEYDAILPDTPIVIVQPELGEVAVRTVSSVETRRISGFGQTIKVTVLRLDGTWFFPVDMSDVDNDTSAELMTILRGTTIYAGAELLAEPAAGLPIAEVPIPDDVFGSEIELNGQYPDLLAGRWAVVSGERADIPGVNGVYANELVMLQTVTHDVELLPLLVRIDPEDSSAGYEEIGIVAREGDRTHTFLTFAEPLQYRYKRATVKVNGNVVKATHGETRNEPLGSGNAVNPALTLPLKAKPLTYVSAVDPSGIASTLAVRVDGVLWEERESLIDAGEKEAVYTTRTDDEGRTSVSFGNGVEGRRPPTGVENITARYRVGIGKPGNVRAKQISLLASRPLGVKSVENPLPSSGGADAETRDQARRNAPLAVMALDRLVSVRDYADFARTFGGIGKAYAQLATDGRRQSVNLSILGVDNIPLDVEGDLVLNLQRTLRELGDPSLPIRIHVGVVDLIVIQAQVQVDPAYLWENVKPNVTAALLHAFSFDNREFGQAVLLSEVVSVIHAVEGVTLVIVEKLDTLTEDRIIEQAAKGEDFTDLIGLHERITPSAKRTLPAPTFGAVDMVTVAHPAAHLAFLSPEVPDTLILTEYTS